MKKIIIFAITMFLNFTFLYAQKGIDHKHMDHEVKPQDDFYNYVNGGWMKTAEIPADRTRWGSFDELRENTDKKALDILKKSMIETHENGTDGQKIKDLYSSIMDVKSRNKIGINPLLPYFKKIDAIKNIKDLQKYLIEVTPLGGNPFYDFGVFAHMKKSNINGLYLGGVDLGMGKDYYQKEDEKSKKALADYSEYVSSIYAKTGQKTRDLKGPSIVEFEKSMAKTLLTVEEQRDSRLRYNPYAIKDLKKLVKNINLENYFKELGVVSDSVIITEKKYYENLDKFLNQNNLEIIKTFLKFNLINSSAGMLSEELGDINFEFYGKKLRGQKEQRPLEKRALQTINGQVGEILGKLYVKEAFPAEAKEKCKEMIDYIKKSFKTHIENLTWMSAETKVKALEKLAKFNVKIGYPDKWKDYSNLKILPLSQGGSYFENMLAIQKWNYYDNLPKIGKEVDKTRWGMAPQTVNAYYSPLFNEIVFPAAILQAPFYDYQADAAVNFGGIGAVIGHEISHGFDDSGSLYDANGNLNNWWTKEDKESFEKATNALVEQYNKYEPLPGVFVNGKFTLGENIADLGGVSVAYDGLQLYLKDKGEMAKIDGYTQEQRFFLSWATIWRTKSTDKALADQVKTDSHSPGYFRAIGPLENFNPYYKAFDVKEGNKMFKDEMKRITIW